MIGSDSEKRPTEPKPEKKYLKGRLWESLTEILLKLEDELYVELSTKERKQLSCFLFVGYFPGAFCT